MKQYTIDYNYIKEDIIYKNLHKLLCDKKNKIDKFESWEHLKRKCNPYETIYTNDKKNNICLKKPISRSYFKLCELFQDYQLKIKYDNVLCLAEAPGGFIEYIMEHDYAKSLYANTLIKDKTSIPLWNRKTLQVYDIHYTNSTKNDGDLTNINNIQDIQIQLKQKCDLITADGGIDYSGNYNNQELDSYELLYSEIYTAFVCQKQGGCLIIKFFDIFQNKTIQLIHLLFRCYKDVSFSKPLTSRPSNSEKYIVCKGYTYNQDMINLMKYYWDCKSKLEINVDYLFYQHIYHYNVKFVNDQIKFIEQVFRKEFDEQTQKQLAVQWCQTYNMPIRTIYLKHKNIK